MLKYFWMVFCQRVADYYFYKGMALGWNTIEGSKLLDKYNAWIGRKFYFAPK